MKKFIGGNPVQSPIQAIEENNIFIHKIDKTLN